MKLSQLALVLVVSAGLALVDAQTYSFRYFEDELPLTLDPTQVFVHQAGGNADTVEAVIQRAVHEVRRPLGSVRDWHVAGWAVADVSVESHSDADVQELTARLSETAGVDFASPLFLDARGTPVVITPVVTVGFEAWVSEERRFEIAQTCGEVVDIEASGMPDVYAIESFSRNGFEVLAAANALADVEGVLFAEPDVYATAVATDIPDDNLFPKQWGLHNIGQDGGVEDMDIDAVEAWDLTLGNPDVVVAIFDDGVATDHPDINQIPGIDLTDQGSGGAPANHCDFHGTPVAGCVAAGFGNGGVVGVAPGCNIVSVKFLDSAVPCNGGGPFKASDFVAGLAFCRDNGYRITNTSYSLFPMPSMTTAFAGTQQSGLIHFASTGNDGVDFLAYPASVNSVYAVGASNRNGNKTGFSQYGEGLRFLAPGREIWSTDLPGDPGYNPGNYIRLNGTSYSSPYAAGIAALILSVRPDLTPQEVRQIMTDTCIDRGAPGYDTTFGAGLLNARAAVLLAIQDAGGAPVRVDARQSPELAIRGFEPAFAPSVSPSTERRFVVIGDAFRYSMTVALDGEPVEAIDFGVLNSTETAIDLGTLDIGPHTVTLESAGETVTATFEVAPQIGPLLQVGNGNLQPRLPNNSINSFEGIDLTFGGLPGDMHCLLFSLSDEPSVSPGLVELAIGANFDQLEPGGVFTISETGWTSVNLPLPAMTQTLYFQSVSLSHGAPIPVSDLQAASIDS